MDELISRQAAIDAIRNIIAIAGTFDESILLIDKAEAQTELMLLPSAQPERQKGRWIEYDNRHCECPFCHEEWSYFDNEVEYFNYCPNCGAEMTEGKG